ncbi:MAG: hypothetical protein RI974_426, partial [Actinomycetota bacterium]
PGQLGQVAHDAWQIAFIRTVPVQQNNYGLVRTKIAKVAGDEFSDGQVVGVRSR